MDVVPWAFLAQNHGFERAGFTQIRVIREIRGSIRLRSADYPGKSRSTDNYLLSSHNWGDNFHYLGCLYSLWFCVLRFEGFLQVAAKAINASSPLPFTGNVGTIAITSYPFSSTTRFLYCVSPPHPGAIDAGLPGSVLWPHRSNPFSPEP